MELKRGVSIRAIFTIIYIVGFFAYLVGYFVQANGIAYTIDGGLAIPSIDLVSGVTKLELKDHKLDTPDSIVGSFSNHQNKTLLVGHSTTIFSDLHQSKVGDRVIYNNTEYKIAKMEIFKKSDIDMTELLKSENVDTLVLMTCAGEPMGNTDATHRLIVTATRY